MDPSSTTAPPIARRALGRTRSYVRADVPERLFQWHAPRANRWERVQVEGGVLEIEWLEAEGLRRESLAPEDARWVAPGARWRIASMQDDARFSLEVHADESVEPTAPQPRRSRVLDAATRLQVTDQADFDRRLDSLKPGERCLVSAPSAAVEWFAAAALRAQGRLCWHPLACPDGVLVALVARAEKAIDLLEYLGRDHAVIEAALTGALQGDAERMRWLRNLLARHLVIEEDLLFPAYLEAGGTEGWVNGLCKEHVMLKRQLEDLSDADTTRRFMLLMEAHDEKEEQIVYPDIVARLGAALDGLLPHLMSLGVVLAPVSPAASEGAS